MATKNLARTAIEGGRTASNKWERHYSHAEERAHLRNYLTEVKANADNWYEYDIDPIKPVYKTFADKLGPMYRWLDSRVGMPWDQVRSDVVKAFDTRTTAGRHIVYDHLLRQVDVVPNYDYGAYYRGPEDFTQSYYHHDFYVDADGLMQKKDYIKRKQSIPKFNTNQIANWLSGRSVGYVGKKLFWFIPTGKNQKHKNGAAKQWMTQWGHSNPKRMYYRSTYGLHYYYLDKQPIHKHDRGELVYEDGKLIIIGYETSWRMGSPSFRQDRKLNDKELTFWNTIPEYYQIKVLEKSPTYPNPPKEDYYY